MYFVLFQTLKSQRRHQHPDQDHQGEPRGLQDHHQPEWWRRQQQWWNSRKIPGQLPGKFKRAPPTTGKEADQVVSRDVSLGRQAPLPDQPEAVVPAHGAEAGHGGGGDRGRARELLKKAHLASFFGGLTTKMAWCANE